MNDLISIIVTSYNHAEYLKQRLDTLLDQTYKNKEIIIVDDFSTDSSRDILNKYKDFPCIKLVFLSKNMGYAYACNYGVSLSRGEFIMFAECDDYNEPAHLEKLYENIIGSEDTGVAYSRSNIVDNTGKIIGDDFHGSFKAFKRFCSKDILIPRNKMQKFLITSCVIPNMSASLIRKKYFNAVNGLSESFKVCADWDFWCRMAQVCDFYYVTSPLNNFRRHQTTVREISGLEAQFSEIFELLQNALSGINLTRTEKLKFKINLGYIFAHEALFGYRKGLKSFSHVLMYGFKFEKFFFLLGLIRSSFDLFCYKLRKICIN